METKIIGLTESTITFNEIEMRNGNKLILHGKEEALVDLDTAVKRNEVEVLKKCKLVKCADIDKEDKEDKEPATTDNNDSTTAESDKTEKQEIEDAPKKKRGRGRPKGAKNKKTVKRVAKEDVKEDVKEDNRAVVVDGSGKPVEASTIKDNAKAPEESEATRASIEAMEKLEEEEAEAKEKKPVDESEMEANSQMGRTATVYTGEGTSKVDMKNSFIPESEVAKESDPFIDPDGNSDNKNDDTTTFLDDIEEDDDVDDAFIEM